MVRYKRQIVILLFCVQVSQLCRMPQREFPASLWNPTPTSHSQQVETVCHWHSNTVDIVTISNCHGNSVNSTAANRHVNGSQLFTGQYGSCQQNLPNLIRAVPVSHVSLSVGSFSLGPNQQPAHSPRASVLPYPYPQKVFAPYYDSQDSFKFDPRYNPSPCPTGSKTSPSHCTWGATRKATWKMRGYNRRFFGRAIYPERRKLAQFDNYKHYLNESKLLDIYPAWTVGLMCARGTVILYSANGEGFAGLVIKHSNRH